MVSQETLVNLALNELESTANHVCFTDCLDLLKPILLAKLVKSVVGLIEKFNQLLALIELNQVIEALNITKYNRHDPLGITEVLLSLLDARAHNSRHEDVEDLL